MRNKIKSKFLMLICSVFIFIVLFVLISYVLRPVTNNRQNLCGFYAEDDVDVVFVGGSACYCAWQPLQAWKNHGYTSYNFALDAMQPQVVEYVIKEIERHQSPELFVIDLRPFQYGDLKDEGIMNMEKVAPFRNFVDNIKYSYNRYEAIKECAPVSEEKWTYHFDIAKYHSGFYNLFHLENWQYIFNEKKMISKGFHFYDEITPIDIADTAFVTESQVLSEEINDMFIGLLEYCKSKGHQVLFVVYPYSGVEEDQKKFNYMVDKIEEYGFGYLDMHERMQDIGLDRTTDFYDWNHVNLVGADKVTCYLDQYLVDYYDLPDHRDNQKYESWNEDYEIWNEEMDIIRNAMQNN